MANLAQVLDDNSSNGKKIIEIYEGLGLSMYEANGQLKSGYDLLKDLASVWQSLDGNTQKYIATTVAGTTQLNNFLALENGFTHALEANEVALNSAGSAAKENERYMESLNAKASAVKATFQQLSTSIVDSGLVKAVLDLANAFLQLASTPLGVFVTQATLLTGVLWGGTGLINAMKLLPAYLNKSAMALEAFGTTLKFGAPQLTLVAIGITAITTALVKLYPYLKDWFKMATDEGYAAEKALEDYNEELAKNKEHLEEINAIPVKNRSSFINDEKEALEEQNKVLEENIKLENQKIALAGLKSVKEEQKSYIAHAGSENRALGTNYLEGTSYLENVEEALLELARSPLFTEGEIEAALEEAGGSAIKALENLGYEIKQETIRLTSYDYYKQAIDNFKLVREELLGGDTSTKTVEAYAKYREQLKNLAQVFSELTGIEVDPWISEIVDDFQKMPDITQEVTDKLYSVEESLTLLSKGMVLNSLQVEQLESAFPGISQALTQTNEGFIANTNSMGEMLEKMGAVNGEMKAMCEAYAALNSSSGASKAQVDILTKVFPQLSKVIRQNKSDAYGVAGAYYYDAQALADLAKTGNEWAIAMIKNQDATTRAALENVEKRIEAMYAEIKAMQAATHGMAGALTNAQYEARLQALLHEKNAILDKYGSSFQGTGGLIVPPTPPGLEDIESGTTGGGGGSETKPKPKPTEDPAIKAAKEQIKLYEKLFALVSEKADEEIEALEAQKQEIQEQNEALEEQIQLEESLDALARAKQQKVFVFKDGRFQYAQDIDAVSQAQKELDDTKRQKELGNRLAAIDKEIEKWEDYKDAWSSVVDDYEKEQDLLLLKQKLGIDLEAENWKERLGNLQDYVDKYKETVAQLKEAEKAESSNSEHENRPDEMTPEDQARLDELGRMWYEVKTQEEKAKIHAEAEAIRAKYGYSGGADGSQYIPTHANGTFSARGGMSLVGERGPELRVLNSGDGVIPANVTRNLWAWGMTNPANLINNISGRLGSNVGITIQNFNPNLPNVTDGESFANYLKNNFWRDTLQFVKT